MAKLKMDYTYRASRKIPHPAVIKIVPLAYDYFIAGMRIVNERIVMAAAADELYTFKGIPLRRGT